MLPLEGVCDIQALTTTYPPQSLMNLSATYRVAQHAGSQLCGKRDAQTKPTLTMCFLEFIASGHGKPPVEVPNFVSRMDAMLLIYVILLIASTRFGHQIMLFVNERRDM